MNNIILKCLVLTNVLLQLILFRTCSKSKDTFIREQDEEGFYEIQLLNGDTSCVPPYLEKYDNAHPEKGMFIHYHITKDSIYDFFNVEGTCIIKSHIHNYVKNDTFMLIDQKPIDTIFGTFIEIYYNDTDYLYKRKYDTVDNERDRLQLLNDSHTHYFWIIGIKTADVYGPFTFEDYLVKRKELGVPNNLQL